MSPAERLEKIEDFCNKTQTIKTLILDCVKEQRNSRDDIERAKWQALIDQNLELAWMIDQQVKIIMKG